MATVKNNKDGLIKAPHTINHIIKPAHTEELPHIRKQPYV